MASLSRDPNGRFRILFLSGDGKRRTIRLGAVPQRVAETARIRVEALAAAVAFKVTADDETYRWAESLGDEIFARLAAAGLVKPRESTTLQGLLAAFAARAGVKESTRVFYGQTARNLRERFGESTPIRNITAADAEDFRDALIRSGLARNTVARRMTACASIFRFALRRKLVSENVFAGTGEPVRGNPARQAFISEENARKVLEHCPTAQWRAAFALARWGGLRVPSELVALSWGDVNFSERRITVRASKTAHHADGGVRIVPMFPELQKPLLDLFTEAEPGASRVFDPRWSDAVNLRTRLLKIVRRAGLAPWPRLWQNLRATRETELFERYPAHVAAGWIGNTVGVALKHYTMMRDTYFDSALKDTPAEAAQNPAQQTHASGRNDAHPEIGDSRNTKKTSCMHNGAHGRDVLQNDGMGGKGLEPLTPSV